MQAGPWRRFCLSAAWLLLALLAPALLLPALPLQAGIHASVGKSWDLAQGGGETQATALWAPYGGVRVSQLQGVPLAPAQAANRQGMTLAQPQANLQLPQLIWLWDYHSYGQSQATPFDFMTAYLAAGQAQGDFDLTQTPYQVQGERLTRQPRQTEAAPGRLNSLSLGLYGGESFLYLDVSLRRLWGTYDWQGQQEFSQIQLLLALGLGF